MTIPPAAKVAAVNRRKPRKQVGSFAKFGNPYVDHRGAGTYVMETVLAPRKLDFAWTDSAQEAVQYPVMQQSGGSSIVDANRFDVVARAIGNIFPRRAVLAGVVAPGLATVLACRPADDADAKKKKKKKCKGNKKKCGKKCIPKTACCGGCGEQLCCDGVCAECCVDGDCPTGATCESGSCTCGIAEFICGDICSDLITDGDNCGACGNACVSGECVHGACTCETAGDCLTGCGCVERVEGGSACSGDPGSPAACDNDDDCPIATFCFDSGIVNVCSGICL